MGAVTCQSCGASNSEFNVNCTSCSARLADDLASTAPAGSPAPGPAADPWLGRTVAHYRVMGRVGGGGMGVVYRAEDTKLHRRVALKFLSRLLEHDPQARARFLREARTASQLDHPNIGTIHEIGEEDGTPFIVMALYEGETLRDRIRRGPVSNAEAEQIMGQLIAALVAAHGAGIVHRDVKPSNVILVEGGPLKLVDFGLAKPLATAPLDLSTLTPAGEMIGTIAYMAPEQIEGGVVDGAADTWAVGVVAYELLAGQPPFQGPTQLVVAHRILNDEPRPLRELRPDVPAHLDALVQAALRKAPGERPRGMEELARLVAGDAAATAAAVATRPRPDRWRRPLIFAGAGLLCAGAVAGGVLLAHRPHDRTGPETGRRAVAVLGVRNASGRDDDAWLAGAFAEMLRTELAAGERLRVVPGENVARMRLELNLPGADGYAPDTLERIRKNLGTDLIVVGSYLAIGDKGRARIRLDLRVQDAVRGETLGSVAESAGEAELFDLVARAGAELRRQLGGGALSASEEAALRASEPSRPEAVRLYTAGLERLRMSDALGARDLLARATAAEPDFPLAHAALGEVWAKLGNDARAEAESARALDLSAKLPREEKIAVEARYHEAHHKWSKAIDRWRVLFGFFPDNLEYGLKLAEMQISGGSGKEAFETLAELGRLPPPAGEDPRIWLTEASAAEMVRDFERERTAAQEAIRRAEAHEARLLAARARVRDAWARGQLNEAERALADLEQVRRTFEDAGDRAMVARVVERAGILSAEKGDLVGARRQFEEVLRLDRELGFRTGEGNALASLASVVSDQGELESSKLLYQQAIAILDEVGDKGGQAAALGSYAEVLSQTGARKEAQEAYEEALRLSREIGDSRTATVMLGNLAGMRFEEGDLRGARELREEALALARKLGDGRTAAYALMGLADILQVQGDLPLAQRRLEEAVAQATQLHDDVLAARATVAVATVLFEEDRRGEAGAAVEPTIQVFRTQKLGPFEATAHVLRARILLADGKRAEAQAAVEAGKAALAGQDGETAWSLALNEARVRAGSGLAADQAAAAKLLDETLAKARAGRATTGTLFDLRLERASLASGAERRRLLTEIEQEAKRGGYDATARRAAELLGRR